MPPDEAARLEALHALGILDSPPDAEFDAIVSAASLACGVSVAILGLIDESREWFKAQVGMPGAWESPREISFCSHTILSDQLLEVEDATQDPRFADNPAVTGEPHIRFYAGAPLLLQDGSAVGALCVVDSQPRRLTEAQRDILRCLAGVAARCLENWRVAHMLAQAARDLKARDQRLRRLYEATPAMLHSCDEQGVLLTVSDTWLAKLGYARHEVIGRRCAEFLTPESQRKAFEEARPRFFAEGSCQNVAYQMVRKDGEVIDVLLSAIVDPESATNGPRCLTVIEDVTLRRRAELALATEHRRRANIMESSGLGTWEWNVQTGEARLSEAWAAKIGWTLQDMPVRFSEAFSDTRAERVHPEDLPRAQAVLAEYLARGTGRYQIELRIRHRDGHWVWMLDRGAIITRTPDGRPEWMVGTRQDISSLKQQQEALRKSEEFLERTGRAAGVGGWEVDLLTWEVTWSTETRRIHGVPSDFKPTVTAGIDFYAPEARPVIGAAVERAIAEGDGWDLELRLVPWNGSPIWVRSVGSVTFAAGKPVRLSGALHDITDRVAERLELQRANERLKLATESGGIGIWDWDIATGVITTDAQRRRLFGLPAEGGAQPYVDWQRHVHPEDAAATQKALHDAVVGIADYDIEYRIVWDDGSIHHLRSAAHVVRDRAGKALRLVGVAWDVTDSHALAAELVRTAALQAEASERESALFRNCPDMLSIMRIEHEGDKRVFRFEAVSPAAEWVIGIPPADLIGQLVGTGFPPESARTIIAACEECVEKNTTVSFALDLVTPTGPRQVEGTRTPIRNPQTGEIVRVAGSMRDVTERNRLVAAAHHGQKMEAIGRLAAGVAHDFNNILQSISGSLEIVQDEVSTGTMVHDFAAVGIRAAKRGSYLTHHLLSYARKQTLQAQLVELPILLYDIEKLLRRTLGPAIHVTVRVDPTVAVVRVDPGQLQTALLNLAINASHAMPDGGTLLIESRAIVEADRLWAVLAVIDSGTGMDAETAAQALEPFYTTKGVKGTGLGLSMVQGFAEQSGGKLSIASVPGQGTTVALQLPALAQAEFGAEAQQIPAVPGTGRVLLVDDDSDVLVTTGAFLDRAGFTTIRTDDPLHALALLASAAPIDALVTDYAMPGMNGAELVADARVYRPGLPAAVISGFTELADAASLGEGVVLLHKPFPRDLLVGTLRRLLSKATPIEELFHTLRPNLDES